MKLIVRFKNDGSLSYAEYGDKKGFPILVQHGLIASITDYHLFDRLIEAGARLICIARPGYGESSAYEMKNMAEWGEIVSSLVDELGLSRFDVLGISSGAPYSYAIGYQLPERVRRLFIFSGTPALFDEAVAAHWPYPLDKSAGIPELVKMAHELFFTNLSAEDLARADIKDTMMNDCFGIAQDLKLRCNDWGFKLEDVSVPVIMQHCRQDGQVPFITAELTSQRLPNCRFEAREQGGHFSAELLDKFIRTAMVVHAAMYNSPHVQTT